MYYLFARIFYVHLIFCCVIFIVLHTLFVFAQVNNIKNEDRATFKLEVYDDTKPIKKSKTAKVITVDL